MREPQIRTEMFGRDRYVTVIFELNEKTSEYVSAWLIDPEDPEETPEVERERLIARARALLRQIAGSKSRSSRPL